MLKMLRKKTKLIIWLVVISFCLWGAFSIGTQFQKQGRIAGEIFGKEIPYQEFSLFYKTNQIFSFGGKAPAKDSEQLHRQTWQSLIYAYEARNKKINVTDDEVRSEIKQLLKAQNIENPSQGFYEKWLTSSFGMQPNLFENQLRELLRIQKLIGGVTEKDVTAPSKEELRDRFERENNNLSLDIITFTSEEESRNFKKQVSAKASEWDTLVKEKSYKVQNTGLIALDAIINLWQLPEKLALDMMKMEKGAVSEPFKKGSQFSAARIQDKKLADESKWNDEMKKSYEERLKNQKKYERFTQWNMDVEKRANLKDFTPRPTYAPAPNDVAVKPVQANAKP